ncbi:MAG: hypothetical protein M0P59_10040 [Gallionella sp.]|jgi:PIN domain nuclease of toxin-antitoxin system|nr:hypothetical protein [Gallionella sp.]MCK9354486.1 hypothetical protein [Gallionella sp.]
MKLLLDTHILIWYLEGHPDLPDAQKKLSAIEQTLRHNEKLKTTIARPLRSHLH